MRLVLRASKVRLLMYAEAGYVSLSENGIAILREPGKKPRYVTDQVDELEFFKLVVLKEDRTFRPTELGHEKIREYLQGGDNDKNGNNDRSVPGASGGAATP